MNDGFIKVAAITPKVRVADSEYNARAVCESMLKAAESGAKIMVFRGSVLSGNSA